MKPLILIGLALCGSVLSCQNTAENLDSLNGEKTQISQNNQAAAENNTVTQNCYSYVKNKDTILLSTMESGSKITGNLEYNLDEKDRNTGSVAGIVRGDTLLLNYTFQSEGRQSVRQLAFLKQGNELIEGYADVEEKADTVVFKDPQTLKFSKAMVLEKTGCPIR